jgi:hypothetical protein
MITTFAYLTLVALLAAPLAGRVFYALRKRSG